MIRDAVSERILQVLQQSTEDKVTCRLLVDLIYFETGHPGWWRDEYRSRIRKSFADWSKSK